jgi:hypothetical protein
MDEWTKHQHQAVDAVNDQLRTCAYTALRSAACELRDGTLTLCGVLPSYFLKQMAQVIAGQIIPTTQLSNQINVVYPQAADRDRPLMQGTLP